MPKCDFNKVSLQPKDTSGRLLLLLDRFSFVYGVSLVVPLPNAKGKKDYLKLFVFLKFSKSPSVT